MAVDIRQLTTDPEFDAEPVWSPDGARILFTSVRERAFKIYAVDPDGKGELKIPTRA
jgi:Tol biopolymer transport system component